MTPCVSYILPAPLLLYPLPLLPSTPSFLSPIHLILFMFYTLQLRVFVDISFRFVLEYGFIPIHTKENAYRNLSLTAKSLAIQLPPMSLWLGFSGQVWSCRSMANEKQSFRFREEIAFREVQELFLALISSLT